MSHRRHAVGVRVHAALGRPGGAGRVDDRRHVVGLQQLGDLVGRGGVDRARRRAAQVRRATSRRRLEPSKVTTCSSAGQRSRTSSTLAACSAFSQKTSPAPGVLEDVAALLGRVGVVDRRDDGARAEGAQVGERPLRARAGRGSRRGRRADAERDQAARDLADRRPELGVGHLDPAVAAAEAQRRPVVARATASLAPSSTRARRSAACAGRVEMDASWSSRLDPPSAARHPQPPPTRGGVVLPDGVASDPRA